MKIIIIITFVLLSFQSIKAFSQSTSFYIQIEDPKIIPEIKKDDISDFLIVKSKNSALDKLYKKYKIQKFEKAFPLAVTPSLKNVYHVKCNDKNLGKELIENYKDKIPRLEYRGIGTLTYDPNDYGLAMGQSNLDLVNAKNAWDITRFLPVIDIGISDTGFDLNHEDLNMTLFSGNNTSTYYHGTSVAGCVGAISDNNIGLASIAFNANLVVTSNYNDDNEVLMLAMAGNRVINCSWMDTCGFSSIQEELYNEIRNDWNAIVVFGAGNAGTNHCGNNNPSYPASYNVNVAVSSVGHIFDVGTTQSPLNNNWKDVHEEIIGDSLSAHKHHPTIDVCAPGYNISTTDITGSSGNSSGNYTSVWGTSFAAPQVSATLGLIISVNPCLSADEAVNILLDNADNSIYNIPQNQRYLGRLGTGRLDVYASVSAAAESATTYLEGVTLSGNQNIEDNYAIRIINNVTLVTGANIDFVTRKEVTIDKNFTVPLGATFSVDVNVDNVINCY